MRPKELATIVTLARAPVRYARRVKLFLTALAALLLASCAKPVALHGTVIDPPHPAAPLELTQQSGRPFSVDSLRGIPAAVFFGYTRCKDVCPQTLQMLQKAREAAGLRSNGAAIVFVSVDPSRDTPATMRAYLRRIRVNAVGLTGTPDELANVEKAYGVAVIPRRDEIVHGNFIYVLDRATRLRELLHTDTPVSEVASDFKKLAR